MILKRTTRQEQDDGLAASMIPTVSEFTRQITDTLEGRFHDVIVQGEISGWTRAASGHTYFTLKDEKACLDAVLWRGRTLRFPVSEGMKVIAGGRITVYPPRGKYQLDCLSIVPLGQGELQLAFEALKAKLAAEGLFETERKRPLPLYPKKIGLVTSRDGAALRDILTTLRRRMPSVRVLLRSTLVQGAGAAEEIARAIRQLNERDDVDVLIVGRGGGSIEDLWAFNEEVVARAILDSRIPVISAVGHEVDFTIADFVADVRAATPTAAAELAVRDRQELIGELLYLQERLTAEIEEIVAGHRRHLDMLLRSRGLARPLDIVRMYQQRVDDLTHRTGLGIRVAQSRANERLRLLETALRALNPANVLGRGYAIIERDGEPVTRAESLHAGEEIRIRMHDGSREAVVR